MDEPLLEAVPNFSEGVDDATIGALQDAFTSADARVADVHRDGDHNRSVFTVFGTPDQLRRACRSAVAVAIERIDLRAHEGVHPRVGVCDVLPVVPLESLVSAGGSMQHAITLAQQLASDIGELYELPAILYGEAAAAGGAVFAGAHRQGGLAALQARLQSQQVWAHAGPDDLHATAGAVLVGARDVLVAFNVLLESDDLDRATAIARQIRERDGGLAGVRALGLPLASQGRVQVSTNIEQWREVDAVDVLEAVCDHAADSGVEVSACELVGLAPRAVCDRLMATGVHLMAAANPVLESHARRR